MLKILFQLIAAFIGTVSFSILFSTPNKYLPQCGLVGALGWGVHLLTLDVTGSSVTAIFAASAILTICSRYLARFCNDNTFPDFGYFYARSGRRHLLHSLLYDHRSGRNSPLLRYEQFKNSYRHRSWNRCGLLFTPEAVRLETTKLIFS